MTKYVMIGIHNKVRTVKIISPGFECMDHSKELLFVSWVIPLCRIHLTRGEGHGSAGPIGVYLKEDRADSKARRISFDY